LAAENLGTNIAKTVSYQQAITPSYGKSTFVADDTDNHDFRVKTGGKANTLIFVDNPSNQTLTVSVYGAPDATAEISDSDVDQIGSDLTILTTASGKLSISEAWPFIIVRLKFASSGDSTTVALFVNSHFGSDGHLSGSGAVLLSGEKTITTAGTQLALNASTRVKSVVIIAKSANVGQVYVGDSTVDNTINDGLDAGESLSIEALDWMDLADIFLDVDTNGEGVDFYAVKA